MLCPLYTPSTKRFIRVSRPKDGRIISPQAFLHSLGQKRTSHATPNYVRLRGLSGHPMSAFRDRRKILLVMSVFVGKADPLAHLSGCLLIATSGHSCASLSTRQFFVTPSTRAVSGNAPKPSAYLPACLIIGMNKPQRCMPMIEVLSTAHWMHGQVIPAILRTDGQLSPQFKVGRP